MTSPFCFNSHEITCSHCAYPPAQSTQHSKWSRSGAISSSLVLNRRRCTRSTRQRDLLATDSCYLLRQLGGCARSATRIDPLSVYTLTTNPPGGSVCLRYATGSYSFWPELTSSLQTGTWSLTSRDTLRFCSTQIRRDSVSFRYIICDV